MKRTTSKLPRTAAILATAWMAAATIASGTPITVTDLKGRSIQIELVSVASQSVTFRRVGNPKEYTLPVSSFDRTSQDLMAKEGAKLPVETKIQTDVVIGKRRRDQGDSYYMEKQEITSTIKLTNLSTKQRVEGLSGTIIYIGQNTKTPDVYSVLSSQKFDAAIDPGRTFVTELKPFSTSYDSDKKGTNNVGGNQYFGYVLAVTDSEGNVIITETATGSFRLALTARPNFIKEVMKYSVGKTLTERLESPTAASGAGGSR